MPPLCPQGSSELCNPKPQDHKGRFLPEPLQTNMRAAGLGGSRGDTYAAPPPSSSPRYAGPPQPASILDPSTTGHHPQGLAPASFSTTWSSSVLPQTDQVLSPPCTSRPLLQNVGTRKIQDKSRDQSPLMLGCHLQHSRQSPSICPNTPGTRALASDG